MRGLKSYSERMEAIEEASHPVRGAWIEISNVNPCSINPSSHPVRGAWIEIISKVKINENN